MVTMSRTSASRESCEACASARVATWLISATGSLLAPGFLLMAAVVVALLTLRTVTESSQGELA